MLSYGSLLLLASFASAADWPGWRGLEAQGVSETAGPVTWSPTENVRWHVDLSGEGHSSPIVVQDRVFVTAARKDADGPRMRLLIILGIAGVALIAALLLVPLIRQSWMLLVCLGLFVYSLWQLAALAQMDSHFARCFQWVHSFLALGMALIVTGVSLPRRSRWQMALGPALFLLGGLMLWFRPQPQYYRLVFDNYWSWPMFGVLGVLVLGGAAVILSMFLWRRAPASADTEPDA